MLHPVLLLITILVTGVASLTWWRVPTLLLWKTSVITGEFGHFLALIPLTTGAVAWWSGTPWRNEFIAVSLIGTLALLRPVFQAAWIGRKLPKKLQSAFGPVAMNHPPFSLRRLIASENPPIVIETHTIAGGLALDFYRAEGRLGPAPCVVMIHGGCWETGDRHQLPALNHHLARCGYAVAAVSYRLAPGTIWPGQAEDITAAIAHLRAQASALVIDPNRLVLMGRSAGGQLATALAYGRKNLAVRGAVSFYGPNDQVFEWGISHEGDWMNAIQILRQFLGGPPDKAPEAYRTSSAYLIVTRENAVPTLLVHGYQDSLVWYQLSERLHAKLNDLGVPNTLVTLPWANHACDFNPRGPSGQLSWYAIEWFLAAVTK